MNKTQEARLRMSRAVEAHGDSNAVIIATVPAFQESFLLLKANNAAIVAAFQQEDLVTKGITTDKVEAKKALAMMAIDIALPISAYAVKSGNNELKEKVSFSFSDLFRTKHGQVGSRIRNISDIGKEHLSGLAHYGINQSALDTLEAMIDDYEQKVPNPKNAAAIKKAVRENIKNLFAKNALLLKEHLDKTVVGFKKNYPDFVLAYKANRVIINLSSTSTQLKGKIVDTQGKPIPDAVVALNGTPFTAVTDDNGHYQMKSIPYGMIIVTAKAREYQPFSSRPFQIKRGQINSLDMTLSK